LITSDHIMSEVQLALSKPFFVDRLAPELVQSIREGLDQAAELTEIVHLVRGVAAHWQDDLVLATALSGQADFLVTGDSELLDLEHPYPFEIIHPNDFLAILQRDIAGER
jgi:uncharacterized protein